MKKHNHSLLVLIGVLVSPLLTSCSMGPFVPWDIPEVNVNYVRPVASKFNEVLEYYTQSVNYNDVEQATGYYNQLQDYLNYILDLRESVSSRIVAFAI